MSDQSPAQSPTQSSVQSSVQESVVARLRPHGRAMFWPSLALIADLAIAGYLFDRFPLEWENLAVVIGAVVLGILLWLLPLLAWLGHNYTLTTRRIVIRSGLLVRVRQEL